MVSFTMALNTKKDGDHGYIAFVKGQRVEVYGDSLLAARKVVAEKFKIKPNKEYTINIMVAEKPDGTPVVHSTASL